MKIFAFTVTLFISQVLFAQHADKVFIPAGSIFADVVTPTVEYLYKDFKPGRITFKNNVFSDTRFNYDMFTGELIFISPAGDSLTLTKNEMLNIKRVSIDSDAFVYDKGYMQVILENKGGTLLKKQQYVIVAREKIGGYDAPSSTSAIDSYTSLLDNGNSIHRLRLRENVTFELNTAYFVGDEYNLHLPANKKNLEKIFFKKKNEIEAYLKQHAVNFNKKEDLIALFTYLTTP